jgi:dienelactone hydrolase
MNHAARVAIFGITIGLIGGSAPARAQQLSGQEFPPPQGKGRVVVMSSGISGPAHYTTVAQETAKLGYDVVLFDSNAEEGTHGAALTEAITQALAMPHALPGKVALVGFSAGGGESLYYGAPLADQVAGIVVWYPANSFIKNVPGFASRLVVPLVAFAGGKDHFRNSCCTAAQDQVLQTAAQGAGKSFDLTVYPNADHDFVKDGARYDAASYTDAFKRMADALKQYLGT